MYKRLIREFPFSPQQVLLFADFGPTKRASLELLPRFSLAIARLKKAKTPAPVHWASSLAVHNLVCGGAGE